jgi:hypothetical protein
LDFDHLPELDNLVKHPDIRFIVQLADVVDKLKIYDYVAALDLLQKQIILIEEYFPKIYQILINQPTKVNNESS